LLLGPALVLGPVLGAGGRAALPVRRVRERGERARHVVEDPLPPFLLGLARLPPLTDPLRGARVGVAEHVRVPSHELLVHRGRDRLEVAGALLLQQQREEVDLEEEVAQLVEELLLRSGERGVGDLVRRLYRVRDDRLRRLLPVPRTVLPKSSRQLLEIEERTVERHGATARSSCRSCSSAGARSRRRTSPCSHTAS